MNKHIKELATVKPRTLETSKEFVKCRFPNQLIMEYCKYLAFQLTKIKWSYCKLFPYISLLLFLHLMRFRYINIKPIKQLSTQHFINSFDDFKVLGLTVDLVM